MAMPDDEEGMNEGRRVIVSTYLPPTEGGGVERFLHTLFLVLDAAGYEVRVLSRNEHSILEKHIRPFSAWQIGRRMKKEYRQGDIVLCNNYFSWNAPKTDSVVVFHGTERGRAEATRHVYSRLRNTLVATVNSGLDRRSIEGRITVAVSEATKAEITEHYGTEVDWVIPNAVDTSHFVAAVNRSDLRRELGLPENEFLVLCTGISDPRKGGDVIRNEIIPGLRGRQRLVIFGHAENTPEDAISLGPIPFDRMNKVYAACNAFVMPSYYEGCAYVILEALSCGIPSVVAPTGVGRDLMAIPVLAEYVVPCDEPKRYIDCLLRLQTSGGEWRRVSNASRRTAVELYDIREFERQYLELFRSLGNPRPSDGGRQHRR
jgi:glycosyltransferase involved in cell wall biosynthesis